MSVEINGVRVEAGSFYLDRHESGGIWAYIFVKEVNEQARIVRFYEAEERYRDRWLLTLSCPERRALRVRNFGTFQDRYDLLEEAKLEEVPPGVIKALKAKGVEL